MDRQTRKTEEEDDDDDDDDEEKTRKQKKKKMTMTMTMTMMKKKRETRGKQAEGDEEGEICVYQMLQGLEVERIMARVRTNDKEFWWREGDLGPEVSEGEGYGVSEVGIAGIPKQADARVSSMLNFSVRHRRWLRPAEEAENDTETEEEEDEEEEEEEAWRAASYYLL